MSKIQALYMLMVTVSLVNVGISIPGKTTDLKKSVSKKLNVPESSLSSLSPFTLTFLSNIPSFEILRKMFSTDYNPDMVGKLFHDTASDFMKSLGATDFESVAKTEAQISEKALENGITPLEFAIAVARTLDQYFSMEGDLKPDKAQSLIKSFIQKLEEAVSYYEVDSAKSSLLALTRGAINFFKQVGIKSPDNSKRIIEILGSELKKVSKKL